MESRRCVLPPRLFPVIEHWGKGHLVDLKLGHFRRLSSPGEVVEFESERGKEMCVAVGVVT